jgi:hypothetical protein
MIMLTKGFGKARPTLSFLMVGVRRWDRNDLRMRYAQDIPINMIAISTRSDSAFCITADPSTSTPLIKSA